MLNNVLNRYRTLFIIVFFIILIIAMLIYTAEKNESFSVNSGNIKSFRTVIVDAGHGGADGGTTGIDGSVEKEINLQIAQKLKTMLNLYGFNVVMTRESDDSIHDSSASSLRQKKISDIHNRLKIINSNTDALFISIHQNHFENSSVHGTQVFYSKNNVLSQKLAQCVQDSVVKNTQSDNSKQIKKSGTEIYLLYHSHNPSIMIECGFMSNSDDVKLLHDDAYQKKLVLSIADGIINYFKESDVHGSQK